MASVNAIAYELVAVLLEDEQEHVVRAAVRLDDKVYTGLTHLDCYYLAAEIRNVITNDTEDFNDWIHTVCDNATAEEGFTTNTGRFMDREEAYEIAQNAKQTSFRTSHDDNWLDYSDVERDPRYNP
jgi:hypothetical protein